MVILALLTLATMIYYDYDMVNILPWLSSSFIPGSLDCHRSADLWFPRGCRSWCGGRAGVTKSAAGAAEHLQLGQHDFYGCLIWIGFFVLRVPAIFWYPNNWMVFFSLRENPAKMDNNWGWPHFWETSTYLGIEPEVSSQV